jgi:hypothetical protein
MQTAHSRFRPSHRALALICVLAGLAACGMAGSGLISPAFSQTPSPVTLGLFAPDLADIAPAASEKLKDATNCYPKATFKVGAVSGDTLMQDALMQDVLSKARQEDLAFVLKRLGLDPGRFNIEAGATGSHDAQVTYPNLTTGKDTDAPKLKTNSVPKKGTRVKAGDTIKVTITASERYEDGHKSWPTGVRSIQLLANDGKVADKDYGIRPPPCERRTEVMTYIVPSNPPPIVHLHALAEDAVGNQSGEDGDFPTGDWYGTLKAHGQGNIYNDDAIVDFAFSVAADGTATGKGRAKVANAPQFFSSCTYTHTMTPDAFDVDIGGRRDGGDFKLELSKGGGGTIQFTVTACTGGGGGPRLGPPGKTLTPFGGVSSESFFHPRVRAEDGATNAFHESRGATEVTGRIEIHSAKN